MATQNGTAPATAISPEKEKALSAALTQIDRKYGKGSIMKMGEAGAKFSIETIPTGAIALVYLVDIAFSFFGKPFAFIHGNSVLSIVVSLVVVVVAALNLVLDFDFIENGVSQRAPKYMEWYAAFGLMVTLVWLYLEILRLLSKLNSRN